MDFSHHFSASATVASRQGVKLGLLVRAEGHADPHGLYTPISLSLSLSLSFLADTLPALLWDVDGCNAAAGLLQTEGFPETVFTETEVWDIGHHGARLRVTDVTGNGVDTDAAGNAIPISYECNMVSKSTL